MVVPAAFLKGALDVLEMRRTVGDVTVRHIVENTAEGIEHRRILTHLFAEESTGPMETLAARSEDVFWVVGNLFNVHSQHLRKNGPFDVISGCFLTGIFFYEKANIIKE